MNLIKSFISIISPKSNRKRMNYLVVDNNKQADKWGGMFNGTKIVATKCDEFETEEEALLHIENKVSKDEMQYIELFKKQDWLIKK